MKKVGDILKKISILLIILVLILTLVSCGDSIEENEDEKTVNSDITTPYFTLDKASYKLGDKIGISLFNSKDCNRVVITEFGREPSAKYSLNYRNIEGNDKLEMPTKKLTKGGDYTLWLCGENSNV